MKLKGFFITGTDTGVGKTAVAAALAFLMNNRGVRTVPVKPVQTGVVPGEPGDLELCLETCGLSPEAEKLKLMNPYRFRLPASPHLAAEYEGKQVEIEHIINSCAALTETCDALVVEGAGGLLVPLTREISTIDLARALGLPLIVVARAGLGTINHSLLTLRAAGDAGLEVAAVVPNHPEPDNNLTETEKKIEADNREIIRSVSGAEVLEPLPHVPGAGKSAEPTRRLARLLAERGMDELIGSI